MATQQATVEYRDIPQYPGYRAGNDGSIWSSWEMVYPSGVGRGKMTSRIGATWKKMIPWIPKRTGRYQVRLRGKTESVHRLILFAFVGPCPPGMECCHEDGNRLNNKPSNLRWDTHAANCKDRSKHGTQARGERIWKAKLTESQIRSMRSEFESKPNLPRMIRYQLAGQKYGITSDAARHIIARRNWKHVA